MAREEQVAAALASLKTLVDHAHRTAGEVQAKVLVLEERVPTNLKPTIAVIEERISTLNSNLSEASDAIDRVRKDLQSDLQKISDAVDELKKAIEDEQKRERESRRSAIVAIVSAGIAAASAIAAAAIHGS